MLGTRWQPFAISSDLNRLQSEMERLFGRCGASTARRFSQIAYPMLNLWEEENQLRVEAELPGLALDDLEIYVDSDNHLTIKGERKQPELEGGKWLRQERGFGRFERTVELSQDVDAEKVTAELKLGVLTITLPKREQVKPRRIDVTVH
jgi:HSP20 family protein